jgi:putative drug exporter of the RND superfamily
MNEKFPGQSDMDLMANAKVVVQAPTGTTLDAPDNITRIDELLNDLRSLDHIARHESLVDPVTAAQAAHVSPDRTIAYIDVFYDEKFVDIDKGQLDEFKHVLRQARDTGLTVEATGTLFNGQPPQQGASELLGFGVALIVMVIAFASLVAATLPIITAIFGVGISIAAITGATSFISMDSSALLIASMLGIAVAIDYSLFIVSRYRNELNATHDRVHAAARAVGTAGSSVVFADSP